MKKLLFEISLELLTDLLLIALAGDLIYLYFQGKWYDPITVFAVAELIALLAIITLGVARIYRFIFITKISPHGLV